MRDDHPMRARFERQLERRGLTADEATIEALMHWTCEQELAEAQQPRHMDALPEELLAALERCGPVEYLLSYGSPIEVRHHHPFIGPIYLTGIAGTLTHGDR
jgi:uncharacterized coiled-coil protein SlyX